MDAVVMMSSGDEDRWEGVADVVDDRGSLAVIAHIEGDEIPDNLKLMHIHSQVDNGPDLPPGEKVTPYAVCAIYAPGMWMKVEFE